MSDISATTIEYNVPNTSFNNLNCKDYFDFFINNKDPFDIIVTFSSILFYDILFLVFSQSTYISRNQNQI